MGKFVSVGGTGFKLTVRVLVVVRWLQLEESTLGRLGKHKVRFGQLRHLQSQA